jgi:membrane protease YdiL (CAAX protease family)
MELEVRRSDVVAVKRERLQFLADKPPKRLKGGESPNIAETRQQRPDLRQPRIVQLVVIGTVLLIFAFNNRFIQGEYDRFFLEFIVPLFIIVAVWRENPRRYFLQLGDWKLGLTVTAIGVAIMAVIIWIAGQQPDFRAYYTAVPDGRPPIRLIVDTGIDLLAWEFFFRGWLLGTLGRKYGTDAIWLQVIPFALMHVWKPEIEQLSTVVGGAFFGILAWRTHSFIYGWLLHWFMLAWILIVVTGQI